MVQENKLIRSLIQSAKDGNNVALEQLFKLNFERVHSLSYALTGNKAIAEFVTINSLVNAFHNIHTLGENETFSQWLDDITINLALEEIRKKRQPEQIQPDDNFNSSPVARTFFTLNPEDRFIFTLNFTLGFPVKKIEELVNQSKMEIETSIARTLNKLTKAAGEKAAADDTITEIENIFTTIKTNPGLLTLALNKIYDIKQTEFQKRQSEIEKTPEPPEIDKEGKKKKKKIAAEIEEENRFKEKGTTKKISFKTNKKLLFSFFVIIIAVVLFFYFNSSTPKWTVTIKAGTPEINNKIITLNSDLEADATLSTNSSSEATIKIKKAGIIQIFPSTKFQRIGNSYTGKLKEGRIKINTENAEEYFVLQLPGGTVTDYYSGTDYVAEMTADGDTKIKLNSGWLWAKDKEVSAIFPDGFSLKISASGGIGLPYQSNSDPKLIELLDNIVFKNHFKSGIDALLTVAAENETITLWNLLQRVDKKEREIVYNKLYELVPHPDAIKKEKILNLDLEALQVWLEEIELSR